REYRPILAAAKKQAASKLQSDAKPSASGGALVKINASAIPSLPSTAHDAVLDGPRYEQVRLDLVELVQLFKRARALCASVQAELNALASLAQPPRRREIAAAPSEASLPRAEQRLITAIASPPRLSDTLHL